jgi:ketosteroid isomerase-like protein
MATSAAEHPNAARVRQWFATFGADATGGVDTIVEDAFHDGSVLHVLGDASPLKGRYQGGSGVADEFFRPMVEGSGGTYRVEVLDVRAAGDELVTAHFRETAIVDGASHTGHVVLVIRFQDGKIAELLRMSDSSLDDHWARSDVTPRS